MAQQLTVFGVYETRAYAGTAAGTFLKEGVPSADISVLLPENTPATEVETKLQPKSHTTTAEGATPRGVLDGPLAVLVGLGMLAIPGLGPLVGESTLKAGLAGLGVESAVGNLAKYLINMGVPELEAKRYEDRLKQQAILLAVRCESPEEAARIQEIAKRTGAEDVCIAAEASAVVGNSGAQPSSKTARGSQ